MDRKHFTIVAVLLALLLVSGCRKPSTQNATATTSADQTTANQSDNNAPVQDNLPEKTSAAPGAETAQNEAPPRQIIPAGTPITIRLQQRLSSASAVPGQRFEGVVDEPIVVGDQIVVPVGAVVEGHVIVARRSGRLHHPGQLGLTLDRVTVDQQIILLNTSHIVARGKSHKRRNWGWIGGGTGGGAVIGALAAGGKGALIGSGIGAAAGTTTAFFTGKKDVTFGDERLLRFRLNREVSVLG
jgi:outer membrane murein-binding lipoprotein Lpp